MTKVSMYAAFVTCLCLILFSCSGTSDAIYSGKRFSVYPDRIEQGKYTARASSADELVSNYQSSEAQFYPRKISFKFTINEKDIESPSGQDHIINIGDEHVSPIIVFGKKATIGTEQPKNFLPPNYNYTIRVDMSEVMRQFKEVGYYTAFDGSRVAKQDFKGFCIAGGSRPLSWDFSNLEENGLRLSDPDGDNIYEITLKFNPLDENALVEKRWTPTRNLSARPTYKSDQTIVDALYKMSCEESLINIEPDSTFRTGAKWSGVWTRDISYSIVLAFAYLQPDVAKISLMRKVKRDRIVQDTVSGGAWPVSSDRTTWVLAAWEIYKVTGDRKWLEKVYPVIVNTLEDDLKTLYDSRTGLYRGESSFLDWREQTYPKWMDNRDIFVSENLGTNVVHAQALHILGEMSGILGKDGKGWESKSTALKSAINKNLWQQDKGYYGQYLYGRDGLTLSPRFEALGEALAIYFDVADKAKSETIIAKSPMTDFGATCIFPQIPGIAPYHNNAIWPFVQSYYNLAAAKAGNETVLNSGLASVYRPAALFLTNYENFVAENGDYEGTEINSDHMLWSMAGNLSIVHRLFMGMDFQPNGIRFAPAIPKGYDGKKALSDFKYRNATLDIVVEGHGNKIASFELDGKKTEAAFISGDLSGKHSIRIVMQNNDFKGEINEVPNHFTCTTPNVSLSNNKLNWPSVDGAVSYKIYRNNTFWKQTASPSVALEATPAEFRVSAIDKDGYEGFTSEPIKNTQANNILVEAEKSLTASALPYINFSGTGFIELTKSTNTDVSFNCNVSESGDYRIDFRYANGSGPWNTDNKCAIRSVYLGNKYEDVIVMPQRGAGEWSDWGYTNSIVLHLDEGTNLIRLVLEDWNNNMNVETNSAMLDFVRVSKI